MSTLTVAVLSKYKNPVFVETGTHLGDGLQIALDTGGFEELHSIEKLNNLYQHNRQRYANQPQVKLYLGDSRTELWNIIKDINRPITFWLDAHFTDSPIREELAAIAKHNIKTHKILIDDVRLWDSYGISIEEAKQIILAINPKYIFHRKPNFVKPDDIFAAECVE